MIGLELSEHTEYDGKGGGARAKFFNLDVP